MKTVTNTYTISYLSTHPKTKNIVHRYLLSLAGGAEYIERLHCTLDGLAEYNMGGGIPYVKLPLFRTLSSNVSGADLGS